MKYFLTIIGFINVLNAWAQNTRDLDRDCNDNPITMQLIDSLTEFKQNTVSIRGYDYFGNP